MRTGLYECSTQRYKGKTVMPELSFKGKEFVFNHHLAVPHRPLVPDAARSVGEPRLDGNLIIHGDNLHALKSLLPMYAGKVDCIFIDPPYNTGNEGWCYNDNVNSPMMQQWLNENPVGIEDGLRHDKWCAMMWPRLRLLHELLGDVGSIWITLDDNEVHRARGMLDSIFGEQGFIASIVWQARYSVSNDASVSNSHNHILVYSKAPETWKNLRNEILRNEKQSRQYSNLDNDPEGPWRAIPWDAPNIRENLSYPITTPKGTIKYPPKGRCWSREEDQWLDIVKKGIAFFGKNEDGAPSFKRYLKDAQTVVPTTWWPHENSGHTDEASKELTAFNLEEKFATPKPVRLLEKICRIATQPDSIILDSFAGSGTTAHAVLAANQKDGGNRKFILVECEDYADNLTAERVRRVIGGYDFQGTQREELLKRSITFTDLKNSTKLLQQIASIENMESHRFDKIEKKVKDGELLVEGVKSITDRVEGLGGSFTYCTLGEAIDMEKMLTGENLPGFEQLGAMLYYMATNEVIDPAMIVEKDGCGYLGESSSFHVWLIYKPELDFLKSRDSALTLSRAKAFAAEKPGKRHLVFAPAKFVSQKVLDEERVPVEFAPLPWALYRIDRSR
jgi:adenine-specific DNA-methyltransferase